MAGGTWDMKRVEGYNRAGAPTDDLRVLLREGWEPFAVVDHGWVYLRKYDEPYVSLGAF